MGFGVFFCCWWFGLEIFLYFHSHGKEVNKEQTNGCFDSVYPKLPLSLWTKRKHICNTYNTASNRKKSKGESTGNFPCNSLHAWRCQSCASSGRVCLMKIFPRHPIMSLVISTQDYPSVSANLLFNWPVLHLPRSHSSLSEALAKKMKVRIWGDLILTHYWKGTESND